MLRRVNRRSVLRLTGLSLAWLPISTTGRSFAQEGASREKVLVCVFMRGGVDGLSVVAPYAEPEYYKERSNIALAPPGKEAGALLKLDDRFGLHPSLGALEPWFKRGKLAAVHAVGSPHPTRSHFDAQDYMESGIPGRLSGRDGWVNRCMQQTPGTERALRGIALSPTLPRALDGAQASLALSDLNGFKLPGDASIRERLSRGFESLYAQAADSHTRAGREALTSLRLIEERISRDYRPEHGAEYPRAGRPLLEAAQLIKADLGVQMLWIDVGGWDTHAGQGHALGQLANRLAPLGDSLAAFAKDLGRKFDDVVLLTMSEFGRTVSQNGTGGTDHGHGTAMLVFGGRVRGGKVYGVWPGLGTDQRHEGRDLKVTTDFRDLFGEIAQKHLEAQNRELLFPGHAPGPALGVL